MKAAVISIGSESSKMVADAMQNYFDSVDEIDLKEIQVTINDKELEVLHDGKKLDSYDCIYMRGPGKHGQILSTIASALSGKVYMPLSPTAYTVGHDKFLTQILFQKKKIPMPPVYLATTPESAKRILENINYPIIIKLPSGALGRGVLFSESYASAKSMLDALFVMNQSFIIQEYVETGGVDIRALVAGGKVVASMKRKAHKMEKRANIHAGGKGTACILDSYTQKIAIAAAEAIKADVCAVDILEGPKGPVVIEVNLSPGLQGITEATKTDVADKIANSIYKKTNEFITKKGDGKMNGILQDIDIAKKQKADQEIITSLDFRGGRILLPGLISKMSGFKEGKDYSVRIKENKIVIEESKF